MSDKLPNIVFIMCDDLAWGDLSSHGNPYVRTDVIDRLRSQSARLTRYCSGPVCTPARAAIFTGRHPYRTRAIDTYLGRSIIDSEERTLAELLRTTGYCTGLFGKWHLGDTYPSRPHDKGFHEAIYHTGGGLRQPGNVGRNSYFNPDLMSNGRLIHTEGYCSDVFTDACLKFIDGHRSGPFFAFLAFNAPHSPFEIGDKWLARHRAQDLPDKWKRLYGMIENIDWNVGRVIDKLDMLKLSERTIVVFTSDHGPCPSAQVDGQDRFNAGLRGRKGQMYEGGLRVPSLWRWPGHFPAGLDIDRLTNPIDILPTLTSPPTDRCIDGRNLMKLLRGDQTNWPDRSVCVQWHRGNTPQRGRNAANLRQRWKWIRDETTNREELFDVESDPHERYNITEENQSVATAMRIEYEKWFDDVSTTRADNFAPQSIVIGSPRENPTTLTWQDWRIYGNDENWSELNPGYWIVQVDRPGPYILTIDLLPQISECTLIVHCGEYHTCILVPPGLLAHEIENVCLTVGTWQFEAYLDFQGRRVGVKNVHVRSILSG